MVESGRNPESLRRQRVARLIGNASATNTVKRTCESVTLCPNHAALGLLGSIMNPLLDLQKHGQLVWLEYISWSLLTGGDFKHSGESLSMWH